jgi:hypothetical protein
MLLRKTGKFLLLSLLIGARNHRPERQNDRQERNDSCHAPSEHTGILLIAEFKDKLPKPGHLCFGHMLYEHGLCSVA